MENDEVGRFLGHSVYAVMRYTAVEVVRRAC